MAWYKNKKIILPILLVIILGVAGLVIWLMPDPVSQLIFSCFQWEQGGAWENYLGIQQLQEGLSKASQLDAELSIDGPLSFLGSMKVNLHSAQKPKQSAFDVAFGIGNFNLLELKTKRHEKQWTMEIPTMGRDVYGILLDEHLEEALSQAPLFKKLSESQQEQLRSLLLGMRDQESGKRDSSLLKEWPSLVPLHESWKQFRKSFQVRQAQEKEHPYNGKNETLKGYDITIPKQKAAIFLDELAKPLEDPKIQEEIAALLPLGMKGDQNKVAILLQGLKRLAEMWRVDEGDLDLTLYYLGKQAISVSLNLNQSGVNQIALDFYGGEKREQNFDLSVTMEDPKFAVVGGTLQKREKSENQQIHTEISLRDSSFHKDFQLISELQSDTGELKASLKLAGKEEFPMELQGKFQDVVKGKSFSFVIDSLSLGVQGNKTLKTQGEITLKDSAESFAEQGNVSVDLLTTEHLPFIDFFTDYFKRLAPMNLFSLGLFEPSVI